jgi:hypothetical protein
VPEFEFPVPLDFVALMANYGGSVGVPFTIRWPRKDGRFWPEGTLIHFDPGFVFDWDIFAESVDEDGMDVAWLAGCENATSYDGTLSLALGGRWHGRVLVGYGFYEGSEGLIQIAPSLSQFLARVQPDAERAKK